MTSRFSPHHLAPIVSLIVSLGAVGGAARAQVPPHLDILSATIEELPPIDRDSVPGRGVALHLEVAGTPSCSPATGFLAYGFLIDADANPATGLTGLAFDDLGVEARITAVCDPPSGLFTSRVGSVTVTPGVGTTVLEIRTTVERLPSLGFRWIAFGQEGTTFSRLPQSPEHAFWTTSEKGVF